MDSSKDTDLEAVASEAAEAVEVGAVSEAADSVVEERVGSGRKSPHTMYASPPFKGGRNREYKWGFSS